MSVENPQNRPGGDMPEARHRAEEARDALAEKGEGLKREASNAAHDAQARAQAEGERAIHGVGAEFGEMADALEKASGEMDDRSIGGRLFREAAGGLHQASDAFRDKSLPEVASELSGFGRRNPAAFLGIAALAGFAMARFATAQPEASRPAGAPPRPSTTPGGVPASQGAPASPAVSPSTTAPAATPAAPATPTGGVIR